MKEGRRQFIIFTATAAAAAITLSAYRPRSISDSLQPLGYLDKTEYQPQLLFNETSLELPRYSIRNHSGIKLLLSPANFATVCNEYLYDLNLKEDNPFKPQFLLTDDPSTHLEDQFQISLTPDGRDLIRINLGYEKEVLLNEPDSFLRLSQGISYLFLYGLVEAGLNRGKLSPDYAYDIRHNYLSGPRSTNSNSLIATVVPSGFAY